MGQTMNESIAVILCAYTQDRWSDLLAAVSSVRQQTLAPTEIIVVIDHNPALLQQAQEQLTDVVVVENREARGLSGARNSGIAQAKSAYIAFLDDDAVAEPDWLMLLCQELADPRVLGCGGTVAPLWLEREPAWLPPEFLWVVGCTYAGVPTTVSPVRNPIGASMCFRRTVFEGVGGFRHGIGRVGTRPVGCEETELCIRASQHWSQALFLYQPAARVLHRVPRQRATWRYFRARCYAEGLSKAFVARHVGAQASLSSERSYTSRTLPAGVLRNLSAALFHREGAGWGRAAAICAGLGVTLTGYLVGSIFSRAHDSAVVEIAAVSLPAAGPESVDSRLTGASQAAKKEPVI